MKSLRYLSISVALALAVAMLWTAPTLAQMRGKGQGGWGCGQGQGQGMGYGAGYGTCPNNQGYQNSQGNWSNDRQANMGRRGPRGGGRNSQPNSQSTVSPTQ